MRISGVCVYNATGKSVGRAESDRFIDAAGKYVGCKRLTNRILPRIFYTKPFVSNRFLYITNLFVNRRVSPSTTQSCTEKNTLRTSAVKQNRVT